MVECGLAQGLALGPGKLWCRVGRATSSLLVGGLGSWQHAKEITPCSKLLHWRRWGRRRPPSRHESSAAAKVRPSTAEAAGADSAGDATSVAAAAAAAAAGAFSAAAADTSAGGGGVASWSLWRGESASISCEELVLSHTQMGVERR